MPQSMFASAVIALMKSEGTSQEITIASLPPGTCTTVQMLKECSDYTSLRISPWPYRFSLMGESEN